MADPDGLPGRMDRLSSVSLWSPCFSQSKAEVLVHLLLKLSTRLSGDVTVDHLCPKHILLCPFCVKIDLLLPELLGPIVTVRKLTPFFTCWSLDQRSPEWPRGTWSLKFKWDSGCIQKWISHFRFCPIGLWYQPSQFRILGKQRFGDVDADVLGSLRNNTCEGAREADLGS